MKRALLVGNPNCGKTTLFNALTGSQQRIGNWPGVTVEKKTGHCKLLNQDLAITDLPGLYSLSLSAHASIDTTITAKTLLEDDFDLIINVLDASHLERHLYLSTQLLERGKPLFIVLNMMDLAREQGIEIDCLALEKALGCPVFAMEAHHLKGVEDLKNALGTLNREAPFFSLPLSFELDAQRQALTKQFLNQGLSEALASYAAKRFLEGDHLLRLSFKKNNMTAASSLAKREPETDVDILLADARYQHIHQLILKTQQHRQSKREHFTAKLDRFFLHPIFALPLFFSILYLMFFFAIHVGGAFQDFFNISTEALFVKGSAALLTQAHAPAWLIALIAYGLGVGLHTSLTFLPVMACMFFCLSFLEASGYMARAAFIMDRLMRFFGLPSKSFMPMIIGFGCNVPAIMSARTLENSRDRLFTILISPFMSCSARLAIYTVFVAAFFPHMGATIVFSLYLVGIMMGILTGLVLRSFFIKEKASPLILELPTYHRPSWTRLWTETRHRLWLFLKRTAKVILPVCMLLGLANHLTLHGELSSSDASSGSVLAFLGQKLSPLFSPLGIQENNWPATVGLLTGMLAKEVVIGTLNTLYLPIDLIQQQTSSLAALGTALYAALSSIPEHFHSLGQHFLHPFSLEVDEGIQPLFYTRITQSFDGKIGAYAYLLFILLYIPCVSTMAVIRQETHRKWMWFSVLWSFLLAYGVSVCFYQTATFIHHPLSSLSWLLGIGGGLSLLVVLLSYYQKKEASHASPSPSVY